MRYFLGTTRYILDGVIRINGVQVYPIITPTPPTEISPVYAWGACY